MLRVLVLGEGFREMLFQLGNPLFVDRVGAEDRRDVTPIVVFQFPVGEPPPQSDRFARVIPRPCHVDRSHAVGLELLLPRESPGCEESPGTEGGYVSAEQDSGSGHGGSGEDLLRDPFTRMTGDDMGDLVSDHGGEPGIVLVTSKMPVWTPTLPPGRAKAFGVGSSKTTNSQWASGTGMCTESFFPTRWTGSV